MSRVASWVEGAMHPGPASTAAPAAPPAQPPTPVQIASTNRAAPTASAYRDVTVDEAGKVLDEARSYKGVPYAYGGGTRQGIDCSHLVWSVINTALPDAGLQYAVTQDMPKQPQFRPLTNDERLMAGDVILLLGGGEHHVGFYDPEPPEPGRTLLSAEGDVGRPTPGVSWASFDWWVERGATVTYLRVRVPAATG